MKTLAWAIILSTYWTTAVFGFKDKDRDKATERFAAGIAVFLFWIVVMCTFLEGSK